MGTYKNAVIMTVYNRPSMTLMNVFAGLAKAIPADTVVIVVDDGSTKDYSAVKDFLKQSKIEYLWKECDTVQDRPGTYHIDGGYNNPSYAFNVGLKEAHDFGVENVFIMSSDIIVPPHAIKRFEQSQLDDIIFVASVIDMDSGGYFCSPSHVWPMPWFVATKLRYVLEIDGWDEKYLEGIAFEDNDFMARLFAHVKHLVIDSGCTVFHQSHPQTAYSDKGKGWSINEAYTAEKWHSRKIPFRENGMPLAYDMRNPKPGFTHLFNPKTIFEVEARMQAPTPVELAETDCGNFEAVDDPGEITPYGKDSDPRAKRRSITTQEITVLTGGHDSESMFAGLDVIEIGTGLGISTRALADVARHVYSVDIDPWVHEKVWPPLKIERQNVSLFKSWDELAQHITENDVCIRAAFIDGDHRFQAVMTDIHRVRSLVGLGQTVRLVLHDMILPEVAQAASKSGIVFKQRFNTRCGIGVYEASGTDERATA